MGAGPGVCGVLGWDLDPLWVSTSLAVRGGSHHTDTSLPRPDALDLKPHFTECQNHSGSTPRTCSGDPKPARGSYKLSQAQGCGGGSTPVVGRNPAGALSPTQGVPDTHPGCPGQGGSSWWDHERGVSDATDQAPFGPPGLCHLGQVSFISPLYMRRNLLIFLLIWVPVPPPLKRGHSSPWFPFRDRRED